MEEIDVTDEEAVLEQIRAQAQADNFRITIHAQQEMVEENSVLMKLFRLLLLGRFWKTIPSTVEGPVV
jgi:hypothetical protein